MKARLVLCAAVAAAVGGCSHAPGGPSTAVAPAPAAGGPPVLVFAAGSLRAALGDVAQAFQREKGTAVALTFGASGLLRDRLAGGETAQVFASANMEHPQALAASGRAEPVQASVSYLLGAQGQAVLARHGFSAP